MIHNEYYMTNIPDNTMGCVFVYLYINTKTKSQYSTYLYVYANVIIRLCISVDAKCTHDSISVYPRIRKEYIMSDVWYKFYVYIYIYIYIYKCITLCVDVHNIKGNKCNNIIVVCILKK